MQPANTQSIAAQLIIWWASKYVFHNNGILTDTLNVTAENTVCIDLPSSLCSGNEGTPQDAEPATRMLASKVSHKMSMVNDAMA